MPAPLTVFACLAAVAAVAGCGGGDEPRARSPRAGASST